jgi:hypothetical protein
MVSVLAKEGLLTVTRTVGAGNRRQLELTSQGAALVERCGDLLESRFESLVRRSAVPYKTYQRHTQHLLAHLDSQQVDLHPRGAA